MKATITTLLLFAFLNISAQIFDNFSDGNINADPPWQGDTADFIVNSKNQLQLSASSAGSSQLYIETSYPQEIEWEFFFLLDFSPSVSNQLRIDLMADDPDLNTSNSYYIEVGESGSEDALKFFRSDNGTSILLGTGTLGELGGSKAQLDVRISYTEDGIWSFYTDYEGNGCLLPDFEVFDNTHDPSSGMFFSIRCKYSSTRVDKFFFDDISIKAFEADITAPTIASFDIIDENTIQLNFNELVEESTALNTNNYSVTGIGNPSDVNLSGLKGISLEFPGNFVSGTIYNMDVSGIEDLFGNTASGLNFEFFLSVTPDPGEVLINEILFNPYPDHSDFIEFYNNSSKFINLKGLIIENTQRDNDFVVIEDDIIIQPEDYVVITEDVPSLGELYNLIFPEKVLDHNLPSFNNDEGNVSLFKLEDSEKLSIDSFNYDELFHYPLLFDVEGVSLERISLTSGSDDPENWHSAAENAGFATPGYENSQFIKNISGFEDPFEFNSKVFSPNNDSNNDFLVINYNLNQPGFAANIKIFDVKGRLIRILSRNLLLGTKGFVKWDGTNRDSELSSIGIYIVFIELIHPTGDINTFKKTCVLADFLN